MKQFQVYFGNLKGGFSPEKIFPEKMGGFKGTDKVRNKPFGSFWTCPLKWDKWYGWTSDWVWFSESNYWDINVAIVFTPRKDVKVFTVDTLEDLKEISTLSTYDGEFKEERFKVISFESLIQKGYDGIHATERAVRELHSSFAGEEYGIDSLYCWDLESTAWFYPDWYESFYIHEVRDYRIVG